MSVAADWPERLRLAQQVTQCTPNGEARTRFAFEAIGAAEMIDGRV